MKALLLVCSVLLVVQCTYDENFLSELKNNEFGQTILATIQLELHQGSADNIVALLRQMRADIEEEQSDSDSKNKDDQGVCESKLGENQATFTRSSELLANDERQLPLILEEQGDKQRQYQDKEDQEQRNNDIISKITEEREESRANYEERRDELTAYVATLQETKRIIQQVKSNSFLQLPETSLVELKKHQSKFIRNHSQKKGYHGLVSLLLEMTLDSQVKQGGVAQVTSIIDELVESIYDLQGQELRTDSDRQQDFETKKSRLELEISRLEFTIADLQAQVLKIAQVLLELNNDININTQIIAFKTQERKDYDKTCADQDRSYEIQTNNRSDEREILDQCITIFETKFDNVSEFIQTIKI